MDKITDIIKDVYEASIEVIKMENERITKIKDEASKETLKEHKKKLVLAYWNRYIAIVSIVIAFLKVIVMNIICGVFPNGNPFLDYIDAIIAAIFFIWYMRIDIKFYNSISKDDNYSYKGHIMFGIVLAIGVFISCGSVELHKDNIYKLMLIGVYVIPALVYVLCYWSIMLKLEKECRYSECIINSTGVKSIRKVDMVKEYIEIEGEKIYVKSKHDKEILSKHSLKKHTITIKKNSNKEIEINKDNYGEYI